MPAISELDLLRLPIADADFGADPLPWFNRARAKHPWLAASDIGFVVTGYRAIDAIMRLDDKLTMPGEEIVDCRTVRTRGTSFMLLTGSQKDRPNDQGRPRHSAQAKGAAPC